MSDLRAIALGVVLGIALCFVFNGFANAEVRTDFSDCKVVSDVGFHTVYQCPDGIIYVVGK